MKIQVLGSGCAKCKKLMEATVQAVQELGLDAQVEKVEEIREIVKFKVLATPALAVDGQVKLTGKVPTVAQLKTLLQDAGA